MLKYFLVLLTFAFSAEVSASETTCLPSGLAVPDSAIQQFEHLQPGAELLAGLNKALTLTATPDTPERAGGFARAAMVFMEVLKEWNPGYSAADISKTVRRYQGQSINRDMVNQTLVEPIVQNINLSYELFDAENARRIGSVLNPALAEVNPAAAYAICQAIKLPMILPFPINKDLPADVKNFLSDVPPLNPTTYDAANTAGQDKRFTFEDILYGRSSAVEKQLGENYQSVITGVKSITESTLTASAGNQLGDKEKALEKCMRECKKLTADWAADAMTMIIENTDKEEDDPTGRLDSFLDVAVFSLRAGYAMNGCDNNCRDKQVELDLAKADFTKQQKEKETACDPSKQSCPDPNCDPSRQSCPEAKTKQDENTKSDSKKADQEDDSARVENKTGGKNEKRFYGQDEEVDGPPKLNQKLEKLDKARLERCMNGTGTLEDKCYEIDKLLGRNESNRDDVPITPSEMPRSSIENKNGLDIRQAPPPPERQIETNRPAQNTPNFGTQPRNFPSR
jgi:hypothetical protein